jgi:hypothetical protein
MKYIITESQLRNAQFAYLDYLFEDMYEVESKKFQGSRVWKKDDKVVLELEKLDKLWVKYSVWSDICNMLSLNYYETQQLIKEWVEQHLELEGITPGLRYFDLIKLVEQHLE